jgi:hypothetical protein
MNNYAVKNRYTTYFKNPAKQFIDRGNSDERREKSSVAYAAKYRSHTL